MDSSTTTLTLDQKLDLQYCIPTWLRDLQIERAIRRVKGRLEARDPKDTRPEPIAVVNFGPSLNETWEQLRGFEHIITCSGAHKFLLERGIVTTYHIDVDPREHKAKLIGTPHKDVQYLIASTCHAAVFDLLEGFNVKLWHVFDSTDEGRRRLPRGEWAITGGCSAGLRCLTMARFLGYTDLHVFGMDGCAGLSGSSHAAEHPNGPTKYATLEYEGRTYRTNANMVEAAKETFHELDMMKDVTVKFYGDGLVQEMAKRYQRKAAPLSHDIAFSKPDLISEEYRELNRKLHDENLFYGVGGSRHAGTVLKLVESMAKEQPLPPSVLDYGCGKGLLAKELPFPIAEYDPAVPGKEESPRPADLVVCSDVLEHIEPDRLNYVLDDLRRCVKRIGYFIIHTGPSGKLLADGRNTHLIQQGRLWWKQHLRKFFHVPPEAVIDKPPLLYVLVEPIRPQASYISAASRPVAILLEATA